MVRKLWDLKLQLHIIEKEGTQLPDVIGHIINVDAALVLRRYNYKIVVCLRVYACVRLIAKGIIRSYSMRRRRRIAAVGIVSNCGVCGGLMFNAQRYMHRNEVSTIWFPYELKKILDRILHELQYLDKVLKLVDGLSEERMIPPPLQSITTATL